MIDRYSLKEMSSLWSLEKRFFYMLKVEKAVAQAQGSLGIIPQKASEQIQKQARFSLKKILEQEKKTRHDVTAFVQEVSSSVKNYGGYVHYGLTSSDVLDTALSLQVREAYQVLNASLKKLELTLKNRVKSHKKTLCVGRTHGIHAEPTTFGFKLLSHLAELKRTKLTLEKAIEQFSIGKLSGAVGAYSALSPEVEKKVCQQLKLKPETAATQVIPRDRAARVLFSLSLLGSFLERLSVELRHLQRTEVSEVTEGFEKSQTGSSAMPHKKNPISGENLTGVSRLLRSYVQPSLENVSLWHERDISHSSVERIIFPDAFILSHYAVCRMEKLLKNLKIHSEKMKDNLNLTQGLVFSSSVLNALVSKGLPRQKAYPLIQKISHQLKKNQTFKQALSQNAHVKKYLNSKELSSIFSGQNFLKTTVRHIDKTLKGF